MDATSHMTNIQLLEYFISVQLEFVSDIDSGPFWLKVYTAFVKGRSDVSMTEVFHEDYKVRPFQLLR